MGRLLISDIFTIGYEGLVQTQLLDLLTSSGIEMLRDCRRARLVSNKRILWVRAHRHLDPQLQRLLAGPMSRKAGFSKGVLGASLEAHGIRYLHDRRLGTPKPGRVAARHGRTADMARIFDSHMKGVAPREGLSDAVGLARTNRICLLCFEREAHACHRSILAGMIRAETGQTIRHL